jgi:hypothetical protein
VLGDKYAILIWMILNLKSDVSPRNLNLKGEGQKLSGWRWSVQ